MKTQRKHIGTSNKLRVISTNGTHGAHQGFSVEPGESYTFEIDLHRPAGMNKEINVVIWKNTGPSGALSVHVLNVDGTNTFTYNATSSDIFIQIRQAGTYYLDNIRMYRTYEDTIFVSGYEVDRAYRYGYNTQERVPEIQKDHYTAPYWEYDPRVVHRWNRDPMSFKYPWQSPYVINNNNPLFYTDPFGLEGEEPKGGEPEKENVQEYDEVKVYGKSKTLEKSPSPIAKEKPGFFKRVYNRVKRSIRNFVSEIEQALNKSKREYSPSKDRNKNPYETDGGIHGVSEEGQALENHKVLYDPKKDNEPKTVNYDELIPGLSGFKNAKVNRKWFDRVKKMQTSTNVADKAREAASEKMGGGSDSGGSKSYSVRDTVWRTETEQWWLYKKDTIIWDIEDGKTSTPRERTYHNYE